MSHLSIILSNFNYLEKARYQIIEILSAIYFFIIISALAAEIQMLVRIYIDLNRFRVHPQF